MTLSFYETKWLIDLVLRTEAAAALIALREELRETKRKEPEFYDGVILHGPGMIYSSDQWLDFHIKVPHWRLRDEKALMDKLSPSQREMLPPC